MKKKIFKLILTSCLVLSPVTPALAEDEFCVALSSSLTQVNKQYDTLEAQRLRLKKPIKGIEAKLEGKETKDYTDEDKFLNARGTELFKGYYEFYKSEYTPIVDQRKGLQSKYDSLCKSQ